MRSGFAEGIAAGIVLTGGSSRIEGAVELAEEIFHMPVRLGIPSGVHGLGDVLKNPMHATGVGLLHYAKVQMEPMHERKGAMVTTQNVFERMKNWFQGSF